MREFKFRAAYQGDIELGHGKIEKGLMFYSEKIEEGLFFIMACDRECRYKFSSVFVDSAWLVMQFTGLLDRNQREIWEDDLVDWFLADGSIEQGRVEYDLERARFAIRFPDGELWGFKADEACSRLEVVGNIYEKAK